MCFYSGLHQGTSEIYIIRPLRSMTACFPPEFTFLTWFPQKTLTFSGFTLLNTVIFLKLRCDWRLDSWVKRNKAWENNPFGYNNRNMCAYYFLGGRKILKYKRHGNLTLLKICQMCADLQFSVKDLRRSFGPPFPKTVTVTKWTPRNTNANNSTGQGKVYMWPRLLWTGHSYIHTLNSSPPSLGNTSSFWQEADEATD